MNSELKTFLANHTIDTKSDTVTVWHAASDPDTLKSFVNEGAKAIGRGWGGQAKGYYVWTKKRGASSHFSKFLATDEHKRDIVAEGLLIATKMNKNEINYPDWQFDLEAARTLNPLLFKYREQVQQIKNLEYVDTDGDKRTILFIEPAVRVTENLCKMKFHFSGFGVQLQVGNGAGYLDLWQAFLNKMCENSDFRTDYNHYLQQAASHPEKNFALKYCGKTPLPIDEVIHVQKDKTGNVTETALYTSSEKKEKQVCPFVKMELARRRKKSPC